MITIIAAVGKNNELGKNGDLCFRFSEDMKFFKTQTTNHPILMGYNTWRSLPGKLPNREHYVLSRDPNKSLPEDVHLVTNLRNFLQKWTKNHAKLFVIGGASVYQQALPFADELILTEIEANDEKADVFFPQFDKKLYNRTILKKSAENGIKFAFVSYKLKER